MKVSMVTTQTTLLNLKEKEAMIESVLLCVKIYLDFNKKMKYQELVLTILQRKHLNLISLKNEEKEHKGKLIRNKLLMDVVDLRIQLLEHQCTKNVDNNAIPHLVEINLLH